MLNIKRRLIKAQKNAYTGEGLERLAELIAAGAYYDEITEAEKDVYCEYRGFDREAMESVELAVTGTLHFQLEKKPKPPTEAQFRQTLREVEALVNEKIKEYNEEKDGKKE